MNENEAFHKLTEMIQKVLDDHEDVDFPHNFAGELAANISSDAWDILGKSNEYEWDKLMSDADDYAKRLREKEDELDSLIEEYKNKVE